MGASMGCCWPRGLRQVLYFIILCSELVARLHILSGFVLLAHAGCLYPGLCCLVSFDMGDIAVISSTCSPMLAVGFCRMISEGWRMSAQTTMPAQEAAMSRLSSQLFACL